MVALELWRAVTNWNDLGYGDFSLSFLKNKEKQEVDFLIADGRRPLILIEAKMTDPRPSNALRKYQEMLNVPAVQVTHQENGFRKISNKGQMILVAPAQWWLSGLP
jgi:predicted AAA+ superfamily ATPase